MKSSKLYIGILWIVLCWSIHSDGQVLNQTLSPQENQKPKIKRFYASYQAAYYYDSKIYLFFPVGINLEYRIGKENASLDFQTIAYHPKAVTINQYEYYSFLTEYFVQYDLGYRMYFDKRKNDLSGAYFRSSIGILTNYSRSVVYEISQNIGYEFTKLRAKEFLGLQVGYKSKINNIFFANGSIGSLISYFKTNDESIILFSPHINVNIGASF